MGLWNAKYALHFDPYTSLGLSNWPVMGRMREVLESTAPFRR